jgi:hypothetical protein
MELFINNPIEDKIYMEDKSDELTQTELDVLTTSFLD